MVLFMKITKFVPQDKKEEFMLRLRKGVDGLGMTANISSSGKGISIGTVRLKVSKIHTGSYDERYGGNYRIDTDKKGNKVAVNIHMPEHVLKLRKSKALNYDDWVEFNEMLNKVADNLGVSLNLKSSWGWVREGKTWGSW